MAAKPSARLALSSKAASPTPNPPKKSCGRSVTAKTRRPAPPALILVDSLFSPSPRVRDAASLGIAGMDDPAAINAVETALANEPTEFIRDSLALVLEQLRETEKETEDAKCRASSE